MKQLLLLISVAARIALLFGFCLFMNPIEAQKPRVIISSDIGGTDPDDNQWWTDSYAPDDRWGKHAGANTQLKVREEIMQDWAQRWSWLK